MSPLPFGGIRELNDALRQNFAVAPGSVPGSFSVMLTQAVGALEQECFASLIAKVEAFNGFTLDNDPHAEHDFGAIEHGGERYFWKIDYYDLQRLFASPDPACPALTHRVLTIMRADEY